MSTEEIVKLTREGVQDLIRNQSEPSDDYDGTNRRRQPRWPFPGTVELWPDGGDGSRQWFGTCRDLSEGGLGFNCDAYFEPGTPLEIAFHLPAASFYGKATVRHSLESPDDDYIVGVQFNYED